MHLAIFIGTILILGAFYSWTSRMNAIFFFGRTVAPGFPQSANGKAITNEYRVAVWIATILSALVAWSGSHFGRTMAMVGVMVEIAAFFFIFARANRQVRRCEQRDGIAAPKESIVEVALLDRPNYWIPRMATALLPPVIALAGLLIGLFLQGRNLDLGASWETLQQNIEQHGGAGFLGMATGMLISSTGLLLAFLRSARLRSRHAQYTVRACVVMQWIGVVMLFAVLLCNLKGIALPHRVGPTTITASVIAVLGILIWKQARSKQFVPPSAELGDDDRWRWGLFYIDRSDPALFVQSRCGTGYSLNYGKPVAWPIAFAIVAYLFVMLFITSHQ